MKRNHVVLLSELQDFKAETVVAASSGHKRLFMIADPFKDKITYRLEVYSKAEPEGYKDTMFETIGAAIEAYNES